MGGFTGTPPLLSHGLPLKVQSRFTLVLSQPCCFLERLFNSPFKEAQENVACFPDIKVEDFEKMCAAHIVPTASSRNESSKWMRISLESTLAPSQLCRPRQNVLSTIRSRKLSGKQATFSWASLNGPLMRRSKRTSPASLTSRWKRSWLSRHRLMRGGCADSWMSACPLRGLWCVRRRAWGAFSHTSEAC